MSRREEEDVLLNILLVIAMFAPAIMLGVGLLF